jgi:high affinity Mn2+ porin
VDAIKGPATKLAEALDGIEVEGSITAVVQKVGARGTASGRDETRANYRGDLTVTCRSAMGDSDGKFFTHFRFGQGTASACARPTPAPEHHRLPDAAGADDSFAILAQAWYQLKIPLMATTRARRMRATTCT